MIIEGGEADSLDIEKAKTRAREEGAISLLHYEICHSSGPKMVYEEERVAGLADGNVDAHLEKVQKAWVRRHGNGHNGHPATVRAIAVYAL